MRGAIVRELGQLPTPHGRHDGRVDLRLRNAGAGNSAAVVFELPTFWMRWSCWAYACLPALLVAPVVAESFAGTVSARKVPATLEERRRSMYAKVAAGALLWLDSALLAMIMGLTIVCLSLRDGYCLRRCWRSTWRS